MPIYEYQCQKCGIQIEKRQSVSDEPLRICESCGGELVKKVSLSGFQFKGAGWYVTDYAGKNGKAPDKPAGKEEKSSSGESTTSGDNASKSTTENPAATKTDKPAAKD